MTIQLVRPRNALIWLPEGENSRLPSLHTNLLDGGIRRIYAVGGTATYLRENGFSVTLVDGASLEAVNAALRNPNRVGQNNGSELPESIDLLYTAFTDLKPFVPEFGQTNDSQYVQIVRANDMDRVGLVLSACLGRRVVIARCGWERGISIDLREGRAVSEAWVARRIAEAMGEVTSFLHLIERFQDDFAGRLACVPRVDRPSTVK